MMASARLHPAVVRLLLKHGAQVNMRTQKGETALTLAPHTHISTEEFARRMQSETIRLLTKAGAKE
jgi:ankyrin repeat protein